jgi:ATP-dependent Clp protease ATP-binding subunit ClpX
LIPEFIGRLPIIAALQPLDHQQLVHILTEPKNAMLKQYRKLLAMDGVELHVTPDGLDAMAEDAFKRGTGARALRSIFEKLMLEVMFEAPSRDDLAAITVDREVVQGHAAPRLLRREPNQDAA